MKSPWDISDLTHRTPLRGVNKKVFAFHNQHDTSHVGETGRTIFTADNEFSRRDLGGKTPRPPRGAGPVLRLREVVAFGLGKIGETRRSEKDGSGVL